MALAVPILEVKRTEGFTSDLLANMYEFKTQNLLTDFEIKVQDVSIPCHSVVMAAASPYFRALFECSLVECTEKQVEVDLHPGYLQQVVDYCYTGSINIALDTAHLCLEIVEYFQLTPIKGQIEEFVQQYVSPQTCIGWYFHADKYGMQRLKVDAKGVMMSCFNEVIKSREFLELTPEELVGYISQDIAVADRGTILSACITWMKDDVMRRSDAILDILPHVPLNRCSQSRLKHVLKSFDPWCPNYNQIQQVFVSAILDSIPDHVTIRNEKLSILVAGGFMDRGLLNRSYWRLNLITGECEHLGELPHKIVKYCAAQTAVDGGMFFAGGSRSNMESVPSNECAMYMHATGKWIELPPVLTPTDGSTAVSIGSSVIVVGGTESRGNVMEVFNLETREWKALPRLVQKTTSPLVATNGDCLYIIMNNSNPMLAMSMQCYDLQSETWQLRKLPEELQITKGACAVMLGGELFVLGGTERVCMRYRRCHDVWVSCARPLRVHRYGAVVAVGDAGSIGAGQIILCGGWDDTGKCQRTVEVYDVDNDKWALSDVRLPAELRSHLCVVE